jgi:hypothetical protein
MGIVMALLLSAAAARASPYWVEYEPGNGHFPEDPEEGWTRYIREGGAQRSLQDGALVLDSLASPSIVDEYSQFMPSLPEANELFVCEWRLQVNATDGCDPGMFISFGAPGDVFLQYYLDRIYSMNEMEYIAEFAPGVYHDYALTSSDLTNYALYIDGALVHVGEVNAPGFWAFVTWGDVSSSYTSFTGWDYVRFGVVPEPSAGLLLGAAVIGAVCGPGLRRRTVQ